MFAVKVHNLVIQIHRGSGILVAMAKDPDTISDIRRNLATIVLQLRTDRGLSQTQLGTAVGMTRYQITDLETGRNNFNQDQLHSLATFFGTTVDLLLGRDATSTKEFESLLERCRTLSPDQEAAMSWVINMQLRAFGVTRDN